MSSEAETSLIILGVARDLIRSLPVRSTFGLPVYVAASPAAPFSTPLRFARNDKIGLAVKVQCES
jgi:hypothetical protein